MARKQHSALCSIGGLDVVGVHFLACGLGLYLFTSINAKPMYYISFTQEQFVQKSKQRSKEPILQLKSIYVLAWYLLVPCLHTYKQALLPPKLDPLLFS